MRVDQLLTTCSVLGGYYNREASSNILNPEPIRDENVKKRGQDNYGHHLPRDQKQLRRVGAAVYPSNYSAGTKSKFGGVFAVTIN